MLYSHIINMHIYTYTCRIYIDAIIKTSKDFFKKYIPLTLLKGLCVRGSWRLNKDCNILTSSAPPDIAVYRSRSPGLLNRRPRNPLRWVLFSLPHPITNGSGLPNWLNFLCTQLYNSSHPPSCGRHNFALIQPVYGQGYNILIIPWADAPVIYIGAFPILTARPGRRSIYNSNLFLNKSELINFT